MNKKILLGSVFAVFVLVAISLTSVASTDNKENHSPLYIFRTERANDLEVSVSDSADYVGFGEETVQIPEIVITETEQNLAFTLPVTKCWFCPTYVPNLTCFIVTCHIICKIGTILHNC